MALTVCCSGKVRRSEVGWENKNEEVECEGDYILKVSPDSLNTGNLSCIGQIWCLQ